MNEFLNEIRKRVFKEREDIAEKLEFIDFCDKLITSTFIGALAEMEKNFGFLWGHGKAELNDDEKFFRKLWMRSRQSILDNGNDNLKRLLARIDKYVQKEKDKGKILIKGEL